jgi:acyl-CoA synthetase (NDP forming)
MEARDREHLTRIFHAKSLAVIGASLDPMKFGGLFLKAILDFGFKGRLYPVNPRGGEAQGIRFFREITELPDGIDLAAICVPREQVVPVLKACVAKGMAGAQILTAGFKEADDEVGEALEKEVAQVAAHGIRVVGPNCFGIYCPQSGLTMLPGNEFSHRSGPVGFISQSGGVCADLGQLARGCGLYFSLMVSYGNGCDLNAPELLEYLACDTETGIIGAYIEGVAEGRGLLSSLSLASANKPVLVWKAGLSETGRRAAASHTGSLAGSRGLWMGMLQQANVVSADGLEEFIDKAMAFINLPPCTGRRVAVVGGGGAISVEAADAAESCGLSVPRFSPRVQEELKDILPPPGNSVRNPVDVGHPMIPPQIISRLLEVTALVPDIDLLAVVQIPYHIIMSKKRFMPGYPGPLSNLGHHRELLDGMCRIRERCGKPMVLIMKNIAPATEDLEIEHIWREYRDLSLAAGFPVYPTPERAFRSLDAVTRYWQRRSVLI